MAVQVGYIDMPVVPPATPTQKVFAGLPWKPLAAQFWGAHQAADGIVDAFQAFSRGFATDAGDQVAIGEGCKSVGTRSFQTAGSSDWDPLNSHTIPGIYAFVQYEFENTPDAFVMIDSWDCFGWSFTILPISAAGSDPFRLYYIAYSSVTLERKAGAVLVPASGAGATVNCGFQPALIETQTAYNPTRSKYYRGGVKTASFQGFRAFNAYEFGSGPTPGNGGGFAGGTGAIDDLGITCAITGTGFTLSGVPPVDVIVQYLALNDTDPDAGFWAGSTAWPTSSDHVTGPGFQPNAVTALHSGGKNGDRFGRVGYGATDDTPDAGAIFGEVWTDNVADPTGFFGTGHDKRAQAQKTNGPVAFVYGEDETTLASQNVTFNTDGFTLSGSTLPDANAADLILTAVRCPGIGVPCPTVVSASANTHAHKRAQGVTSFRAETRP